MSHPDRTTTQHRLKRIGGQVAGVSRMLEEDKDCVDILLQISAIQGALGRVSEILLSSHIEHCVAEAFDHRDTTARAAKIEELMTVFSRYGGTRRG